jgi:hypothetical protein
VGHHPVVQTHRRSLINPAERLQLIATRTWPAGFRQRRPGKDMARWVLSPNLRRKAALKHASSEVIDRSASCSQRVRETR